MMARENENGRNTCSWWRSFRFIEKHRNGFRSGQKRAASARSQLGQKGRSRPWAHGLGAGAAAPGSVARASYCQGPAGIRCEGPEGSLRSQDPRSRLDPTRPDRGWGLARHLGSHILANVAKASSGIAEAPEVGGGRWLTKSSRSAAYAACSARASAVQAILFEAQGRRPTVPSSSSSSRPRLRRGLVFVPSSEDFGRPTSGGLPTPTRRTARRRTPARRPGMEPFSATDLEQSSHGPRGQNTPHETSPPRGESEPSRTSSRTFASNGAGRHLRPLLDAGEHVAGTPRRAAGSWSPTRFTSGERLGQSDQGGHHVSEHLAGSAWRPHSTGRQSRWIGVASRFFFLGTESRRRPAHAGPPEQRQSFGGNCCSSRKPSPGRAWLKPAAAVVPIGASPRRRSLHPLWATRRGGRERRGGRQRIGRQKNLPILRSLLPQEDEAAGRRSAGWSGQPGEDRLERIFRAGLQRLAARRLRRNPPPHPQDVGPWTYS